MYKIIIFCLFLLPLKSIAQFKISGRVLNQADTKPVANASVFLSNATTGAKTAADGLFTLNNVKPGKYIVVVTSVGYETYNQSITVEDNNIRLPDIALAPKTIALKEVSIKPQNDFERNRNYELFKEEFLGTSALAKACKILNPEVLDFNYDEKTGTLTASSGSFLVIINEALGYRVNYLLSDFIVLNNNEADKIFAYAGSVLFEPMKGTPAQQRQWQTTRQEVYEGSQLHFLRSALNNRIGEEGFRVSRLAINPQRPADSLINARIKLYTTLKKEKQYRDSLSFWKKKSALPKTFEMPSPEPLNKQDIIKLTDRNGLFALTCDNDALFITYNKYHRFNTSPISRLNDPSNTSTLIRFNTPQAFFDRNGTIANPRSLTYEGAWTRSRVAALLPVDYEPQQNRNIITDSTVVNYIMPKVKAFSGIYATENAYLQFDKPFYAGGDTIYFKAYVTMGQAHQLSDLSGILYVDLVDPVNKISRSIKLQLNNGVAWGDFTLPDSLPPGNYRIRAYTRWMRNEGNTAFFDQPFAVGTAANKIPESGGIVTVPGVRPVLRFFPEGGSLVTGVKCKVAFKAVDANGAGINVNGIVLDNGGTKICSFTAVHLGMGYFYIEPEEGKTYKAEVTYTGGTKDIIDLPRANTNGVSFTVADLERNYTIKINSSRSYFHENKNKNYTLVVYSGGILSSFACKLQSAEVSLDILKSQFHSGIATVTLFSPGGEPLCERLLFVQNDDLLKLIISPDKAKYPTRGKVNISLKSLNSTGDPAKGFFSVSVTDESKVPANESEAATIVNNLLLTSELKGYIEQPNYYFTNTSDKTKADLDLVMLTHGYRRLVWRQVLHDNGYAVQYRPEKSLEISGMVKKNSKPAAGTKVTLFTTTGGTFLSDTVTDSQGKFSFKNLGFADSTKFVVQAKVNKGQDNVTILLDSIAQPGMKVAQKGNSVNIDMAAYLLNEKQFADEQQKYGINKHALQLKDVFIKDKKMHDPRSTRIANSQNLNGAGNADQIITAEDMTKLACARLIDCLRARLTGITYLRGKLYVDRLKGMRLDGLPDNAMAIIVDGTVADYEIFQGIEPNDVEGVEILTGPHFSAVYGSIASAGAIVITTKRAKKINNYYRYAPGVATFAAKGFYKAREFYSPAYDNPKANDQMRDLRSTIYWKPDIITDKNGNASFEYYNADGKGTYRVVIEGIDENGNLGRQVFRYKVD